MKTSQTTPKNTAEHLFFPVFNEYNPYLTFLYDSLLRFVKSKFFFHFLGLKVKKTVTLQRRKKTMKINDIWTVKKESDLRRLT